MASPDTLPAIPAVPAVPAAPAAAETAATPETLAAPVAATAPTAATAATAPTAPTAPAAPAAPAAPEAPAAPRVPPTQRVLLLHAPKQPYQVTAGYAIPEFIHDRELLVQTRAIGLNPIDWKSADFNFAIPELPYISGRELAGKVVRLNKGASRLQPGDRVLAISTDYRDLRKGAYQEYVVAWDFNTVRLPTHLSYEEGATLGVAFVAAVLALGVSMGVDFAGVEDGPDLLRLVRQVDPPARLPADVRDECLAGLATEAERAQPGDWLAIWGGSATSANLAIQLARLAGLRVVAVVDKAKHGLRLANHHTIRPDLLVDSHDPQRAVDIIRANLGGGKLRFGLDTRGKDTAAWLLEALSPAPTPASKGGGSASSSSAPVSARPPSPPATPDSGRLSTHLVGLAGLPKQTPPSGSVFHTVPIKLFHELPEIGEALSAWLERLLEKKLVVPPEIAAVETGLHNVNTGLDRLRNWEISGGKLVVRLED